MCQGAGDNHGHSFKCLRGIVLLILLLNSELLQKTLKLLHFFLIAEVLYDILRKHLSDAFDFQKLFHRSLTESVNVLTEESAQDLGIGETDTCDAETVDQSVKLGIPGVIDGLCEILIAFLAEALHGNDVITVSVEMENVAVGMDKSVANEFFQSLLAEAVNIKGITAYKQGEILYLLGRTLGVPAVQELSLVVHADFGFVTTCGTHLRGLKSAGFCEIVRDLRYDHVCFINSHPVADSQVHVLTIGNVVKACPGNGGALKLHGVKDGHRIDKPGTAG